MRLAVNDLGSWIRPHWIRRIENGQKILEKGKIPENIRVKVVFNLRPRCHKQLCFYKSVFPFLRFEHSREGPQTCYLRAIRDTYLDNINMYSVFRHFNRRKFCQTLLLSLLKIHFTSAIVPEIGENFHEAIKTHDLTIVKFQAEWCGACKSMKEDYDGLATQMKGYGSVLIANVDCPANQDLCKRGGHINPAFAPIHPASPRIPTTLHDSPRFSPNMLVSQDFQGQKKFWLKIRDQQQK